MLLFCQNEALRVCHGSSWFIFFMQFNCICWLDRWLFIKMPNVKKRRLSLTYLDHLERFGHEEILQHSNMNQKHKQCQSWVKLYPLRQSMFTNYYPWCQPAGWIMGLPQIDLEPAEPIGVWERLLQWGRLGHLSANPKIYRKKKPSDPYQCP